MTLATHAKTITTVGTRNENTDNINFTTIIEKLLIEAEKSSNDVNIILDMFQNNVLTTLNDCSIKGRQFIFAFQKNGLGVDPSVYTGTRYYSIWILDFFDDSGNIRMELKQFA